MSWASSRRPCCATCREGSPCTANVTGVVAVMLRSLKAGFEHAGPVRCHDASHSFRIGTAYNRSSRRAVAVPS